MIYGRHFPTKHDFEIIKYIIKQPVQCIENQTKWRGVKPQVDKTNFFICEKILFQRFLILN